ncbi:MAG: PQQ-binding-like beta-propeller repeat protein [Terriglobales bacterium]
MRARRLILGATLTVCLTVVGLAAQGAAGRAASWARFGWNAQRTSHSTAPTGITAKNLNRLQRQEIALDGTVDASVIFLHGARINGARHDAFILTTTYGQTEALDAHSGTLLWRYTPPGYDGWTGTYRITNATPVAGPHGRYVYAASPDGRIQKLAVANGHALWRTAITRLPEREKIASSLNLWHGHVVATVGGYVGDRTPYQGHVAILDAGSGRLLHVWNALCSNRTGLLDPASCTDQRAAIWGRAGAVIQPGTGDLFVATGNGPWNGRTAWGDAVVELNSSATRMLANYTPTNTEQLSDDDLDEGSTSPVLLGGGYIAQGGKDGHVRVLQLSAIAGTSPHRGAAAQTVDTPGTTDLFTAPALVKGRHGEWLFVADNRGTEAFRFARGRLTKVWENQQPGTSPVVAGGLLYVYDPRGGALYVYQPGSGQQVGNLAAASGHWNSPIVVDGMIALPVGSANHHQTSGTLYVWRLPKGKG